MKSRQSPRPPMQRNHEPDMDKWWDMYELFNERKQTGGMKIWLNKYKPGGAPYNSLPTNARYCLSELWSKTRAAEEKSGGDSEEDPDGQGQDDSGRSHMNALVWKWRRVILPGGIPNAYLTNFSPLRDGEDLFLRREKHIMVEKVKQIPQTPQGSGKINHLTEAIINMTFEQELVYQAYKPSFDIAISWKHKLELCAEIFSSTGKRPSLAMQSQTRLACWYRTVSRAYENGELSKKSAWLSNFFSQIVKLNEYFSFAHLIGGEGYIRLDSPVVEVERWAKWREDVRRLHKQGKLPPDVTKHFEACSSILDG